MTTTTKSLEAQIESAVEQLLREHLAACEAAAADAVRAAFQRASAPKASRARTVRAPAARRSREVIEAITEQLYEAIRRHPGETMAVIAPVVGATAKELNHPVTLLRRQGRIRTIGQRQFTRYFPMGE